MLEAINIKAPAKINLHLAVGGARNDGFHDLISIFQAVSLFDTLEIRLEDTGSVRIDCEVDCPPEKNTMYLAASLCLAHAKREGLPSGLGVGIRASKGIPSGAGLGGGSSDAAAVIKAMASFHPAYYSREIMAGIAARVGSDVPFFLGSACALVGGRGELLHDLDSRTDYSLILVYPGFPVNTAAAFRNLDDYRARSGWQEAADPRNLWGPELRRSLADAYFSGSPGSWPFRNDFFASFAPGYPALGQCRDLLLDSGAEFASLSGSGSTVFGVFSAMETRETAVLALIKAGFNPIRAFPLARLPELD